jgi:hypothetical protein
MSQPTGSGGGGGRDRLPASFGSVDVLPVENDFFRSYCLRP